MEQIPDGVWPTMITPYTESNKIDYRALEAMVEWYIKRGVDGLFAVCQSSEMFLLSLEERVELARFVKQETAGKIPVIASGHISDSETEQWREIERIAETGIDAFVLVSNRLAAEDESDDVWMRRAEAILRRFPEVRFGIYECPAPYKRLLTPQMMQWCASTGKFLFLKDTCCDLAQMKEKLAAVKGTKLKLFNANSTTVLGSLKAGAAGFSGVMGNFHPELYGWLVRNWRSEPEKAELVQSFLGTAALIERQLYPVNAKYHMQLCGLPVNLHCRNKDASGLTPTLKLEVEQVKRMGEHLWETIADKKAVGR
jgi:4-hydroxy-tetrahydrodipicolinate synthase